MLEVLGEMEGRKRERFISGWGDVERNGKI